MTTYHSSDLISWSIGVVLAILASIVSNVGINLQKLVHSRRAGNRSIVNSTTLINLDHLHTDHETIPDRSFIMTPAIDHYTTTSGSFHSLVVVAKQKHYVTDSWWLFGLILIMLAALMDFFALGFAPASVVAPLHSITLVTNVALAPIMHHEKVSHTVSCATAIIMFGTIITVIFSPRATDVNTTEQLFDVYTSIAFVSYCVPCSFILLTTFGIKTYMTYLKLNMREDYTPMYYKLHRFSIATLSGTIGAQNIFFAKCVSTLVVFTIEGNGQTMFLYLQTYVVVIALFTTIYYQLKWLNEGLIEFSALYIVPIFQSFWITVSVIGGLTVYDEFDRMKIRDKVVFPIGVIITIAGVSFLTSQRKPPPLSLKRKPRKKVAKMSACSETLYDERDNVIEVQNS